MPIVFATGNLFKDPDLKAYAHGCNCAGAMGKGIALEFRRQFPEMYAAYKSLCLKGKFKPGDVFGWTRGGITVFNLGTQLHWKKRATLPAIRASLEKMIALAEDLDISRIGMPRIGAGLGGLPWEDVRKQIVAVSDKTLIELVIYQLRS